MAYATYTEYDTYISPQTSANSTAETTRLLARASELLDAEVLGYATYPVDTDGLPTDADDIAAIRDAACAQVARWEETGDEQGAAAQYSNVRIGDASLTRAGSKPAPRVAPHAVTILRRARLLPTFPAVVG